MFVTKEATFDAAHRLFFHDGQCRNLHGHTYKVQVTMQVKTSADALDLDFADLSFAIQQVINKLDHAFIYTERSDIDLDLAEVCQAHDMKTFNMQDKVPTAENMATLILDALGAYRVRLWETPTSFVEVY